jgi:hypothetical protein
MNSNFLLTVGIIGFVLVILNVVFLTIIFFMRRKMAAVSRWPAVVGTVIASTTEWRRSGNDGSSEYPVVHYTYQVNGQIFQGMKIAPGPEMGGTGAKKVVARYPAGAQVMVFYDPQNPTDAVLEKKAPAQWFMWLMLGIFDCVLCGVLPILWFSIGS